MRSEQAPKSQSGAWSQPDVQAPQPPQAPQASQLWERVIAHVDMDAFFASVEIRDQPELKGRPLAVGGDGPRGVIATASYEARRYGVHSAMATARARMLCPQMIVLPGRHSYYREISREVMDTLDSFTPLREAVSVDEAYLDLTGAQRLHSSVEQMAREIRLAVWNRVHLTCSVGVGVSMSVAKIASAAQKPHGIVVVEPERTAEFLAPLPMSVIGGVGPVAQKKFANLGVATVGDIAQLPLSTLHKVVGSGAPRLQQLARGHDPRRLGVAAKDKSVGKERTFGTDIANPVELHALASGMADEVSHRLRHKHLAARTVSIKLRAGDGRTITRSVSFPYPTQGSEEFRERALVAFERALKEIRVVRLLGVRAEHVVPASEHGVIQADLEGKASAWSEVDRAMDRARERFGMDALGRGTSLEGRKPEALDGTDTGVGSGFQPILEAPRGPEMRSEGSPH